MNGALNAVMRRSFWKDRLLCNYLNMKKRATAGPFSVVSQTDHS